jgi:hypothetical protein
MSAARDMDVAVRTPIKKADEKTFTVLQIKYTERAGQEYM